MKRFCRILVITICLLMITGIKINASSVDGEFTGEVTPKRDFMVGEIPKNEDFTIKGSLEKNGIIYDEEDLYLWLLDHQVEDGQAEITGRLCGDSNNSVPITIKINVVPFINEIKCNYENETINVTRTQWKSEDGTKTIYYYYDLKNDLQMINSLNNQVKGSFSLSENFYDIIPGYNDITYEFLPREKGYNITTGHFNIFYDKKPTFKTYKDRIVINLNSDKYNFYINGKKAKINIIKKLKANTKYKIEIYQKPSEYREETLLWTSTVKTKK